MDFNNVDSNISQIVDRGYDRGMIQIYDEIYDAVDFISKKDISVFLEIGTNQSCGIGFIQKNNKMKYNV